MSKCIVNWDKPSTNAEDPNQTSTRKFYWKDQQGNERVGFRLCLERTDMTAIEKLRQSPFLYINVLGGSIEQELAFEKIFDERKIGTVHAKRIMMPVKPFRRVDRNTQEIRPTIVTEIGVDVLTDAEGNPMDTKARIQSMAESNLEWQVKEAGMAVYVNDDTDVEDIEPPIPTQQPPIQQPQGQQRPPQQQQQRQGGRF